MKRHPAFVDLTEMTFERLHVVNALPHTNKHGSTRWLCQCSCGNLTTAISPELKQGHKKSCGCLKLERFTEQRERMKLRGPDSVNWKGGKRRAHGYVMVYAPGHPRAQGRHVLEHILVMEKKLGRRLSLGENVHHINGVKDDNRPENLELWITSQPSGQRPADLVTWAKEILARYDTSTTIS